MNNKKHPDVLLKLTHSQLRILEHALELYGRVGIGQVEALFQAFQTLHPEVMRKKGYWELVRQFADPIKETLFGFSAGSSFGLGHKQVHSSAQIAYELEKIIQNHIATEEDHHKGSVWYTPPLHYSEEPLASVFPVKALAPVKPKKTKRSLKAK